MGYGAVNNIDPAMGLGGDFDFRIGDGFEQAMGMALGDGDFGKYFQDDVSSPMWKHTPFNEACCTGWIKANVFRVSGTP